ncbi:Hypothetical predicted protein, partial [Mytilus galloprovincialis]
LRIKRFIKKHNLEKSITEAESKLVFCNDRETKFQIPDLPSMLVADQTCSPFDTQVTIPDAVLIGGYKCWILESWRIVKRCSYVQCNSDRDDCQVPPSNTIPVPDKFKCRATNPRLLKVQALLCFCLFIVQERLARVNAICEVPKARNETLASIPPILGLVDSINLGDYPKPMIRRFIRKHNLKKDIMEAESRLAFCIAREVKFQISDLPPMLKAEQTCSPFDTQVTIPDRVLIDGLKCWILDAWRKVKKCSYVQCNSGREDCQVPPSDTIPVPTQFKCRATNPRLLKVYAFCVDTTRRRRQYRMKHFTIPLPQCCTCVRFECRARG